MSTSRLEQGRVRSRQEVKEALLKQGGVEELVANGRIPVVTSCFTGTSYRGGFWGKMVGLRPDGVGETDKVTLNFEGRPDSGKGLFKFQDGRRRTTGYCTEVTVLNIREVQELEGRVQTALNMRYSR